MENPPPPFRVKDFRTVYSCGKPRDIPENVPNVCAAHPSLSGNERIEPSRRLSDVPGRRLDVFGAGNRHLSGLG